MPSPFPGMDPYLEASPFWGDLQPTMITAMKAELQKRVPPHYSVWSDVYIWLHEPDAETRLGKPDVFMSSRSEKSTGGGTTLFQAPASTILPAVRREGTKYLKIKEVKSDRVITVIELLSPINEAGERDAYLAKRNEYLATGTNLVEIDLLRTGPRMPLEDPAPPSVDYIVLICRGADFPNAALWPLTVRDRLPDLPVPLKPEDGVVTLPLQACFDLAYEQGPYQREVDYSQPPRIPLNEPDADWAKTLLSK